MLNLKTLDNINKYYKSKDIEPYWNTYKDKGGLKLMNIISITNRFDFLHKLYPELKISNIGDKYTYSLACFERHGSLAKDGSNRKPNKRYDIFGEQYDRGVIATYYPGHNSILFNHDSKLLETNWDMDKEFSGTMTHEFGHALDHQYKISEDPLMVDFYNKFKYCSIIISDKNAEDIGEFIAIHFDHSFDNISGISIKAKILIDEIINKPRTQST